MSTSTYVQYRACFEAYYTVTTEAGMDRKQNNSAKPCSKWNILSCSKWNIPSCSKWNIPSCFKWNIPSCFKLFNTVSLRISFYTF